MYITSKEFGIRCPFCFYFSQRLYVCDVKSSKCHTTVLFFGCFRCRLSIFPTPLQLEKRYAFTFTSITNWFHLFCWAVDGSDRREAAAARQDT